MTTLLLGLVGSAAGLLGALMGVGGGIVVVPALTQLLGVPFRQAVAVSLVAVIASSSGASAAYVKREQVDMRVTVVLELATVTGAIIGSGVAGLLPVRALKLIFGVVAAWAAQVLWSGRHTASDVTTVGEYQVKRWGVGLGISGVAGAISGLLGVGGGVFKVPVMALGMGLPFKVAAASSNFAIGVTAAASAYLYMGRGELDPVLAAPVVVGVFIGAVIGTALVPRLRARRLQGLFAVIVLLVGVRMALDGLGRLG